MVDESMLAFLGVSRIHFSHSLLLLELFSMSGLLGWRPKGRYLFLLGTAHKGCILPARRLRSTWSLEVSVILHSPLAPLAPEFDASAHILISIDFVTASRLV